LTELGDMATLSKESVEAKIKTPTASVVKKLLIKLFKEIKRYMKHQGGLDALFSIYVIFDELAVKHEELRKKRDWVRGVISRATQYQRYMMLDFESLKVIHDFRTASVLRGYGFIFLTCLPILFGPLCANYAALYGLWSGLFSALLCSGMLMTLYQIQEYVEDPYDGEGPDDVNPDMLLEVGHHMF